MSFESWRKEGGLHTKWSIMSKWAREMVKRGGTVAVAVPGHRRLRFSLGEDGLIDYTPEAEPIAKPEGRKSR
jgi:hypothetical protein